MKMQCKPNPQFRIDPKEMDNELKKKFSTKALQFHDFRLEAA